MNPVQDAVRSAKRRLVLISWIHTSAWFLCVAVALLVVLRGVQKIAPVVVVPWDIVLPASLGLAVIFALITAIVRAPSALKAAQILDERAGLRESLSTALLAQGRDDPWSRVVTEEARSRAKGLRVPSAIPLERPRGWGAPIGAAIALLAVWWLPTRDLTGLLEKQEEARLEEQIEQEVRATVNDAQEQMREIIEKTGIDIEPEDFSTSDDLLNPESAEFIPPDESLRSAIKNLTSVSEKLQEERESEKGQTYDAIREAMKSLTSNESDPASEMARAMARGDFSEAQQQLQKLQEQIEQSGSDPAQREQLAQSLRNIEKQLEQAANNAQQLQEQLEQAGISQQEAQQLARDPQALQQRLESMGIPAPQALSMAQSAQAQQQAQDAASAMSQAASQMAQGLESGDMSQQSQGSQSMSDQLSSMEQLQQDMQALENAMSQAQQQMDQLSNAQQQCENPGNGSRSQNQLANGGIGPGIGQGGSPDIGLDANDPGADYTLSREQAKIRVNEGGPVIASTLVYGSQVRGESTAAFNEAVSSASAQASEAIETKRVPRAYESAVQHYFGRLDRASRESQGSDSKDTSDKSAEKTENASED